MANEVWGSMERHRARIEQVQENTARPGRAYARYTAVGAGAVRAPDVIPFGMAFYGMPTFTFGASIPEGQSLSEDNIPSCSAITYQWQRNSNGMYIGAWVAFTVQNRADLSVLFHLCWDGIVVKDFIATQNFPAYSLDI